MRSDLKIGIIVGVLLVVGLIAFFVSRGSETAEPEAASTAPGEVTGNIDPAAAAAKPEATKPLEQETVLPVEQKVAPPVEQKVTPPVVVDDAGDELGPRYYVVEDGDSLTRIAKSFYADEKFVVVIQETNKDLVKNINILQPGWRLRIPYPAEADAIWKTLK